MKNKLKLSYDYIIIGSGASGSVAAYELTKKNKDVLLLEEGYKFEINHFGKNISQSFIDAWKFSGITPIIGKDNSGFGEAKCYGGGTFINGGLIWRTPEFVLKKWEELINTNIYSYKNLKKYFELVENKLKVSLESIRDHSENNDSKILIKIAKDNILKYSSVPRAVKNCKRNNLCSIGCPAKSKQSTILNYLVDAEKKGLEVKTGFKVIKFNIKDSKVKSVDCLNLLDNKILNIKCNNLVLAAGPVNTPIILRNSIGVKHKKFMQININFRINVMFKKEINAESGTIFTHQIQEYMDDGVLFMPANFNKAYLFSSMPSLSNNEIINISDNIKRMASFVIQMRSENQVKLLNYKHHPLLFYSLSEQDREKIKSYIFKFASFIFQNDVEAIYLPIQKKIKINSIDEIQKKLVDAKFNFVSVHGMSSNAMGCDKEKNDFNLDGRHYIYKNLFCVDSSILPSGTVESPQGTIMAVAHSILDRIV